MNKPKVWKIILLSSIIFISVSILIWFLLNKIAGSNRGDFELAKNYLEFSEEFEEAYGEIKSIEQIGEIKEFESKKEKHVYCKVTTKAGETIECIVVLLMDEKTIWASHWYAEETGEEETEAETVNGSVSPK